MLNVGTDMRIAFFHELDFGGAKRVVMEFAKRLKKDHMVDLYYVDKNKDKNVESFFTRTYFYRFNSKVWRGNNWRIRLYKDTLELFNLYKLHIKIADDIKSKKYDHIFVHPSKFTQAPFLLRFLNNRCIYYCQEPLRIVYDPAISSNIRNIPFPKNIYEFLNRKIRKSIDLENTLNAKIILANSNYSKKFIEKSYGKNVRVCYLGVDANIFKPLNIHKTIDVLFIGNKDEGYNLLNESLRLFKTKPKLYSIFRKNGKLDISDDKLIKIYNKSKVLIALNRNEPFGLILLETMSCGIPVIAVGEGGYSESVINEETGYLIKRNAIALKDSISKLLNNENLRINMSENARKYIEKKWTWDKSIKRFLAIAKYVK